MLKHLFKNIFIEKITSQLEPHELAKDLRKYGTELNRKEISKILQISEKTIARYESPTNKAKIPFMYLMALRFMSGDLSFFGTAWENSKISPTNKKLTTPHAKYKEFDPMSLNSQSSFVYQTAISRVRTTNDELRAIQLKIEALESENQLLTVKNERLQFKIDEIRIVKEQIKKGKVIEFKR